MIRGYANLLCEWLPNWSAPPVNDNVQQRCMCERYADQSSAVGLCCFVRRKFHLVVKENLTRDLVNYICGHSVRHSTRKMTDTAICMSSLCRSSWCQQRKWLTDWVKCDRETRSTNFPGRVRDHLQRLGSLSNWDVVHCRRGTLIKPLHTRWMTCQFPISLVFGQNIIVEHCRKRRNHVFCFMFWVDDKIWGNN